MKVFEYLSKYLNTLCQCRKVKISKLVAKIKKKLSFYSFSKNRESSAFEKLALLSLEFFMIG